MALKYVEDYAKKKGISVEEAMGHAVVKEYLKYHTDEQPAQGTVSETKLVAGCGSATGCE